MQLYRLIQGGGFTSGQRIEGWNVGMFNKSMSILEKFIIRQLCFEELLGSKIVFDSKVATVG
jgi:hypothetical protein